ncbi:MAG: glucose-6-phosphate isomerase [Bacillota bacterium]|nr:glucose-6-phosphate isomerase [Bacillota bacterium]
MIVPLKIDYSKMLEVEGNLVDSIHSLSGEIDKSVEGLKQKIQREELGFYRLPFQENVRKEIKEISESIRQRFENFVVVGIGGSALGNKLIHNSLNHPYYNLLPGDARNGNPRIFVLDTVDPDMVRGIMDILDLGKTVFNVITKSGSTSETMANYLIIRNMLERMVGKERLKEHIIATTDRGKGSLIKIAEKEGYQALHIPENVGGRYSVLSPVGLLSAAVSGVDIDGLLDGAAFMESACRDDNPFANPALLGAVLQYYAYRKGKTISVVMPYSDRLGDFGDWYCQLWAESLGKVKTDAGGRTPVGQTPLRAIGVRDQHSLLQLFLDGPNDKIFTLIKIAKRHGDLEIPASENLDRGIGYLAGNNLEKLLHSEFEATETVLTNRNRLNYRIELPDLSEHSIGQLIFLYMMMTAYMGELLGVDAYNQPAVEEGKRITYRLMGRA